MRSPRIKNFIFAIFLVILIIAGEYLARRLVIDWLPVIGAWRVNDMLISALVYTGLVWLTTPGHRRRGEVILRTAKAIWTEMRKQPVQIAAALAAGSGWLVIIDRYLWGQVSVPYLSSPWSTNLQVLEIAAVPLTAASLLLVNGLIVPFAEERLWRGLIQGW